jgi:hypothetical protein
MSAGCRDDVFANGGLRTFSLAIPSECYFLSNQKAWSRLFPNRPLCLQACVQYFVNTNTSESLRDPRWRATHNGHQRAGSRVRSPPGSPTRSPTGDGTTSKSRVSPAQRRRRRRPLCSWPDRRLKPWLCFKNSKLGLQAATLLWLILSLIS